MEDIMPPAGGNQSKGPSVRATTAPLYVLMLLSFILRMTTRVGLVGHFGWDDFIMIIAMVSRLERVHSATADRIQIGATASSVLIIQSVNRGMGHHTYYLTLDDLKEIYKFNAIYEMMIIIVACLTKVSICFFVLRIPTKKRFIWFLRFLIVSLFATNGAALIVLLASCRPFARLYDPTVVRGSCWDANITLYIVSFQGGQFPSYPLYYASDLSDTLTRFHDSYGSGLHKSSHCGALEFKNVVE